MDKELLQEKAIRCTAKDMEEIVEALRPLIISSIRKYYYKPHLFDELFQEGCVEIIEGLFDYDTSKNIPFLAYIKTRLYYFYLGKNHNREHLSLDKPNEQGDTMIDFLIDEIDIEEDFLTKEKYRDLQIAVSLLPERQRQIIIDFYFKEIPLKDIAEQIGIQYRSCVNSKTQGIANLRKYLNKQT